MWIALVVSGLTSSNRCQAEELFEYDDWPLASGWTLSLYGSPHARSFYPCSLYHFDAQRRAISITLEEEAGWFTRGLVYLSVSDPSDAKLGDSSTLIAMVDRSTIEKLDPGMYPRQGRISGEISHLDDWEKVRGRRLQIVTDRKIFEADARPIAQAISSLKACQRERDLRIRGKWVVDKWQDFHP